MSRTLVFGLAAVVQLGWVSPAAAQTSNETVMDRRSLIEAVDAASAVRIRTRAFEADLEGARFRGNELTFIGVDLREGACPLPGCPASIPVAELVQVQVFRPHPLLAAGIGFVTGFAVGWLGVELYESDRVEECLDPFEPYCSPPLTDAQKRSIILGTAVIMVPVAVITDRLSFAWRTVYRARGT